MGRIVIDKTGLTERYDFTLHVARWSPNPVATDPGAESSTPPQADSHGESIFESMKDQLGLELKDAEDPVAVFVVDHVAEPTPN